MVGTVPTEEEVIGWMNTLSNWGRWGPDDRQGCLNYITPEKRKQAAALVQEGIAISMSRSITYEVLPDQSTPPLHYMVKSGEGFASGDRITTTTAQIAEDFFGMAFHGKTITHVDSLAHFFWQGKGYNGWDAKQVSTEFGALEGSVELAKEGIISRAVLVDVPMVRGVEWMEFGEGVMPEDIVAAEARCGFTIEEGDTLLVRTGQLHRRNVEGPQDYDTVGTPALQAACLPLLHERRIACLGSDTGNDVRPSIYPNNTNPIHQVGIVGMDLWIMDNAALEEVTEACKERRRWEFLLNICPLRLSNSTGSPVNPVAVF